MSSSSVDSVTNALPNNLWEEYERNNVEKKFAIFLQQIYPNFTQSTFYVQFSRFFHNKSLSLLHKDADAIYPQIISCINGTGVSCDSDRRDELDFNYLPIMSRLDILSFLHLQNHAEKSWAGASESVGEWVCLCVCVCGWLCDCLCVSVCVRLAVSVFVCVCFKELCVLVSRVDIIGLGSWYLIVWQRIRPQYTDIRASQYYIVSLCVHIRVCVCGFVCVCVCAGVCLCACVRRCFSRFYLAKASYIIKFPYLNWPVQPDETGR